MGTDLFHVIVRRVRGCEVDILLVRCYPDMLLPRTLHFWSMVLYDLWNDFHSPLWGSIEEDDALDATSMPPLFGKVLDDFGIPRGKDAASFAPLIKNVRLMKYCGMDEGSDACSNDVRAVLAGGEPYSLQALYRVTVTDENLIPQRARPSDVLGCFAVATRGWDVGVESVIDGDAVEVDPRLDADFANPEAFVYNNRSVCRARREWSLSSSPLSLLRRLGHVTPLRGVELRDAWLSIVVRDGGGRQWAKSVGSHVSPLLFDEVRTRAEVMLRTREAAKDYVTNLAYAIEDEKDDAIPVAELLDVMKKLVEADDRIVVKVPPSASRTDGDCIEWMRQAVVDGERAVGEGKSDVDVITAILGEPPAST
eukprot:TRINITY_DN733_c0_g4_i1.p1 TRINITY_DN733_c0_g4~~TRINITY_DN733_c0_g4_i1.p1  ORF type:complete len:366 (-),score=82.28 TRINITY_DN733_c0_g4_i1:201-1298(-)